MINDYLEFGGKIITRMAEQVPELRAYESTDLENVADQQLQFPCFYVIHDMDVVIEGERGSSSTYSKQLVDQVWYVVVAVRNVKDQVTGRAARADAGPLIVKALNALQGWTPDPVNYGPLKRVNGAGTGYNAGFLYFPLRFKTRIAI